jgi:hypothetical protein
LNGITCLPNFITSGSEVISGGHTVRQTGDLISLLSFLESRLKMYQSVQKLKRGTDKTGTQDGDLISPLPVWKVD